MARNVTLVNGWNKKARRGTAGLKPGLLNSHSEERDGTKVRRNMHSGQYRR